MSPEILPYEAERIVQEVQEQKRLAQQQQHEQSQQQEMQIQEQQFINPDAQISAPPVTVCYIPNK